MTRASPVSMLHRARLHSCLTALILAAACPQGSLHWGQPEVFIEVVAGLAGTPDLLHLGSTGISTGSIVQVVQQLTAKHISRRRWGSCSACATLPPSACATWPRSLQSTSPSAPAGPSLCITHHCIDRHCDDSMQASKNAACVCANLQFSVQHADVTGCVWACRMHLQIQVDIHSLQGTVCAWVPPPPNDRLWFGFITAPELKAEVTPIVANDVSPLTYLPCCMPRVPSHRPVGTPLT